MIYKTSGADKADTLFVVYDKAAADAIEAQGGQAIALQDASNSEAADAVELWAEEHSPAGTVILWTDKALSESKRKNGIYDDIAARYIPCMEHTSAYKSDTGFYKDISRTAAEDPAMFAADFEDLIEEAAAERHQADGAGLYFTGRNNASGVVFITRTVQDARSIRNAGGAVIAYDTGGEWGFINAVTEWNSFRAEAGQPTAAAICCNNAEDLKRADNLMHELHNLHIKCILSNLCIGYKAGSYTTPAEAAAEDPQAFKEKITQTEADALASHMPDALDDFLKRIQTTNYQPHATGLPFFDELLSGGVIDGTTLIIQAPPAAGKTTLCLQVAAALAANKTPVVYLNFEMNNDQMLAKAISCQLAADEKYYSTTKILQGYTWNDADRAAITAAVDRYRETTAPFLSFKSDQVSNDLDSVLKYLKDLGENARKAGTRAPAVFVDYLHIITTSKRMDTKDLIGKVVYGVKDYAAKYNTFAVLISAVNRKANKNDTNEGDTNKQNAGKKEAEKKEAPTMADARDSSSIEFSGDYVMALQAATTADRKPQRLGARSRKSAEQWRRMELYLLKNRFGKSNIYTEIYFNAAANYFWPRRDYYPADAVPFDAGEQMSIDPPPKYKRL